MTMPKKTSFVQKTSVVWFLTNKTQKIREFNVKKTQLLVKQNKIIPTSTITQTLLLTITYQLCKRNYWKLKKQIRWVKMN